ncbi:MAG: DUF3501 family protein [Deltaproteobacteria bacterium]|nr:DUF3501 family protein [Deltaproteobacteria bacterium]
MRKVQRSELLDFATYGDIRDERRRAIMAAKEPRRIHVGKAFTFLFENTDTVWYQIQEMMRVERIVREAHIEEEMAAYNAILGDDGELGCVLLIEIEDEGERDRLLRAWYDLPRHLFVRTDDGRMVRPTYDPAQIGDEKLSSVQYLKFKLGDATPLAMGSDHPEVQVQAIFSEPQRQALLSDLKV